MYFRSFIVIMAMFLSLLICSLFIHIIQVTLYDGIMCGRIIYLFQNKYPMELLFPNTPTCICDDQMAVGTSIYSCRLTDFLLVLVSWSVFLTGICAVDGSVQGDFSMTAMEGIKVQVGRGILCPLWLLSCFFFELVGCSTRHVENHLGQEASLSLDRNDAQRLGQCGIRSGE